MGGSDGPEPRNTAEVETAVRWPLIKTGIATGDGRAHPARRFMATEMKRHFDGTMLALLLAIAGLLSWGSLTNGHNWGDDFSAYIMQAKSLLEGRPLSFIEENRFTVRQSSRPIGPVAYPWGFPALLVPIYAVLGLNIIALKTVDVVCFLSFLLLLWAGFREHHSGLWRTVLVCLFALNPKMLSSVDEILSDIPFLLLSTFSVLLMRMLVVERRRLISPLFDQFLIGASIAVAFFVRTNGILLMVTLGIAQLIVLIQTLRRQRTGLFYWTNGFVDSPSNRTAVRSFCINMIPYVSFMSIVLLWRAFLPEDDLSYVSNLRRVSMDVVMHHLRYYIVLPSAFFASVPYQYVFYGASIPLAIAGALSRYRSDHPMIVYVILTFLLYILWPSVQGLRYLFPIFPFYMSFMLTGIKECVGSNKRTDRVVRKAICILPIAIVLLNFGMRSAIESLNNLNRNRESPSGPFVESSRNMFSFIRENTELTSTVIFFKPRVMRMMTGRRSLMIKNVVELSRGDYLCLYLRNDAYNQVSPDGLRNLTEQGIFQLAYSNNDFLVFRRTNPLDNDFLFDRGSAALHPHW